MGTVKKLGENRRKKLSFDSWASNIITRAAPGKDGRYHAYHNQNTLCGIWIDGVWYFRDEVRVNCPKCLEVMKRKGRL